MDMFPQLGYEPNIYNKRFPTFARPKIIGFMSLDGSRQYLGNASQLKFTRTITDKRVQFDLNLHFEDTKLKLNTQDEKISHLLHFLKHHEARLNFPIPNKIECANFFCYRGLLTCIANTPYENREPWRLVATLFQGDIYLCALDTEEKIRQNRNQSEKQKRCTSWGYKFEHFLLADKPNADPNPNCGTDENEEFSLMFINRLNKHTIVYGAEMDGIIVDDDSTNPPSEDLTVEQTIEYLSKQKFIELKTCAHLVHPYHQINFRKFKTRKWWLQSFLVSISTIVCGFRNHNGIVEELTVFPIDELHRMSGKFWKPNVCFNFLDTFLTYVKRCLTIAVSKHYGEAALKDLKKLPIVSLHFEWKPHCLVSVTDNYNYEVDPILPDWFVNNYKSGA